MIAESFATSFVIPTIGIITAVITASLSYYFARIQQIRSENRKLKEEFYRAFIKAVSDTAINNKDDTARQKLSEGFNTLTLVASLRVVEKLMLFHEVVKPEFGLELSEQEFMIQHDIRLKNLIVEMRRDLFNNKDVEKNFPDIHLVGMGRGHNK